MSIFKPKVQLRITGPTLMCNTCNDVIKVCGVYSETSAKSGQVLCPSCLKRFLYQLNPVDIRGFSWVEAAALLESFPTADRTAYYNCLPGEDYILSQNEHIMTRRTMAKAIIKACEKELAPFIVN